MTLLLVAAATSPASGQSVSALVLSEVFYDVAGPDDGLEWIEFFIG